MKFLTKVVPISKSVGNGLLQSDHWNAAKYKTGFLYCKYFNPERQAYVCGDSSHNNFGDFFLESDLIPYEEPKAKESGKGMFVEFPQEDLTKIVFNLTNITHIAPIGSYTRLFMKNGDKHTVKNSYESIKQLLTDKGLML